VAIVPECYGFVQRRHIARPVRVYQERMTEFSNDDPRLRAEEEQMRRALGLRDPESRPPGPAPTRPAPNGPHRPHRRFIRDGEVPVEVVHHEGAGTNQLEAARQAIRTLTAAREQAERQLAEAQAVIRDLKTKLAHERLAKDEAAQRAVASREAGEKVQQSAQAELDTERASRRLAEAQLASALKRCDEMNKQAEGARKGARSANGPSDAGADEAEPAKPIRRRGRPRKTPEPEADLDVVEWWKPGWQERYRSTTRE
jgi:hypothetical protein